MVKLVLYQHINNRGGWAEKTRKSPPHGFSDEDFVKIQLFLNLSFVLGEWENLDLSLRVLNHRWKVPCLVWDFFYNVRN